MNVKIVSCVHGVSLLIFHTSFLLVDGVYRYPVIIYIYNSIETAIICRKFTSISYSCILKAFTQSCFLRYFNARFMVSSSRSVRVVNCYFIDGLTPCVARTLFSALRSSITIGQEFSTKQVLIPVVDVKHVLLLCRFLLDRTAASFLLFLLPSLNMDV